MSSLIHLARNPRYPTYERLVQHDEETPSPSKRIKRFGPSRTQKRCLIYTTIILITTAAFGFLLGTLMPSHTTGAMDNLALALGLHKNIYSVIIDAGSTGSRVLAQRFQQSVLDGSLKLDGEIFIEQKPGLSAFANNPQEGAALVHELVRKAEEFVPVSAQSSTPMVLRATAGLRLLPGDQASRLLDEVQKMFDESPFHTTTNSVAIMDGSDEGLFAWVTVNFLSDTLFGPQSNMLAALDLGGGSTQITFPLINEEQQNKYPVDDIHPMKLFGQQIYVYTHSYLGLGLMESRKAILTMGQPDGATDLASECINPIIKGKTFKYAGVEYTVRGPSNPEILKKKRKGNDAGYDETPIVRIEECTKLAKQHIASQNVTRPHGLLKFQISVFSYFFERATEVGLIDPFIGGNVAFKDLKKAAKDSCLDPNAELPFMCVDLVFISTLLEDGYGLQPETKIKFLKKIDGHEVSWSLGAAFNIIQNGL